MTEDTRSTEPCTVCGGAGDAQFYCGHCDNTDKEPTPKPDTSNVGEVSRWHAFLDHPRIYFNVDANRQFALEWLEDADKEIRAEATAQQAQRIAALREWPTKVREKFRLDKTSNEKVDTPSYWAGYAAAVDDIERLLSESETN